MIRVLFVCLGNICRSPLAEAQFNHVLNLRGLSAHFKVDSSGTANYHVGKRPDARTIRLADSRNIRIEHRGRQLSEHDFFEFDYLLVMDANNYRDVMRVKPASSKCQVLYLRSFDQTADGSTIVPDPYYGDEKDFELMYEQIEQSVSGLLAHLVRHHGIDEQATQKKAGRRS